MKTRRRHVGPPLLRMADQLAAEIELHVFDADDRAALDRAVVILREHPDARRR